MSDCFAKHASLNVETFLEEKSNDPVITEVKVLLKTGKALIN